MNFINTSSSKRSKRTEIQLTLAQFFTPSPIASFMASMFNKKEGNVTLLDPGAGEGILGITLAHSLSQTAQSLKGSFIEYDVHTYESLRQILRKQKDIGTPEAIQGDFVDIALKLEADNVRFTHVIMNPPYFKLPVDSSTSKKLQRAGIQITNIYAAFVWLSARLLAKDGELVAIIPRSFCNGPYFLRFREYIANHLSIDGIHIFNSRDKAFSGDSVLQENVIIHLSKRAQASLVTLTYSNDHTFDDVATRTLPFEKIVHPTDANKTIHIPGLGQETYLNELLTYRLDDLGLNVSTGPVVDFRETKNISNTPSPGVIPLLYPAHMNGLLVHWPKDSFTKKGQYYKPVLPVDGMDKAVDKNVLPLDGYYVIVRRFSSKEEKRRIFATVAAPDQFKVSHISFENHLNYFHIKKHGVDQEIAYGLWAYLNSSIVDEHFRKVSGHTQVNVTDLRSLPYPSESHLRELGKYVREHKAVTDDIVKASILGESL